MKKKKGLYDIKIKYDNVPVCDSKLKTMEELEDTFRKVKDKLK